MSTKALPDSTEKAGWIAANIETRSINANVGSGKHLSGLEGPSYCATFRQGKVLLAFREHLNTNMVGAGRAVFFNAAEHIFQVSPGNHGIDQSIAASLSKIGVAKT